jgi:hypothetical protein
MIPAAMLYSFGIVEKTAVMGPAVSWTPREHQNQHFASVNRTLARFLKILHCEKDVKYIDNNHTPIWLYSVLPRRRNFGRSTQKNPLKNLWGLKNWRTNFYQICQKRAE